MEIQAIIELIIQQASVWAPALTAILGIVISLIPICHKITEALKEVKGSAEDIRKTKDMEQLHTDLRQAHQDNKELRELMNTFIDKAAGIKNYTEKVGMSDERKNETTEE